MLAANPPASLTDHVVVYTDVNIGTELTFDMLFPDDSSATSVASTAYNPVTRIVSAGGLNMHQGLIMGNEDNVFQTGSGTKAHGTFGLNGEVIEFAGTFAGAMGTYRCTEDDGAAGAGDGACRSSGTNLGTMLSDPDETENGGWTFNPDAGENASVADSSYNYFGW